MTNWSRSQTRFSSVFRVDDNSCRRCWKYQEIIFHPRSHEVIRPVRPIHSVAKTTTASIPVVLATTQGFNTYENFSWSNATISFPNVFPVEFSDEDWHVWLIPLLALFALFTTIGNALVVFSILSEKALRTTTNFCLVSLAAADFLVGCIVMPLATSQEWYQDRWVIGTFSCNIFQSFDVMASTCSILNLWLISHNRYMAISKPIIYNTSTRRKTYVAIGIILIWFASILVSAPLLLGMNDVPLESHSNFICAIHNGTFALWLSIITFFIPSIAIGVQHFVIMRVLIKRSKMIRLRLYQPKCDGNSFVMGQVASPSQDHGWKSPEVIKPASADGLVGILVKYQRPRRILASSSSKKSIGSADIVLDERLAKDTSTHNESAFKSEDTNQHPKLAHHDSLKPMFSIRGSDNLSTASSSNSVKQTCQDNSRSGASDDSAQPPFSPILSRKDSRRHTIEGRGIEENGYQVKNIGRRSTDASSMARAIQRVTRFSDSTDVKNPKTTPVSPVALEVNVYHPNSPRVSVCSRNRTSIGETVRRMSEHRSTLASRGFWEDRAIVFLFFLTLGFFTCWLPYFVATVINGSCESCQVPVILIDALRWLGHINSMMNPILYSLFNREFRYRIWRYLTLRGNQTAISRASSIASQIGAVGIGQLYMTASRLNNEPGKLS